MQYEEYNTIIQDGMVEYVNNGYSTFYIGSAVKEYYFEYEDPQMPHDFKQSLNDKAVQSMLKHKSLPEGIRLVKCIWKPIEKGRS